MGCIRVDKITEYLCEPLRKCLKDEDPYVRKTAAICVAKLHDINSSMVEDQGFLDQLKELLSDSNPMVVANAVASLTEINDASSSVQPLMELNASTINKLLTALNECTEWGQVFILDALSQYQPKDEREAQSICERITPRLAHANAAVVLSAVKCLMKFMELMVSDSEFVKNLAKKLAPPLVTLLSSEPEVQYVALRNINLIVQKRPDLLKHEMKVFFVKYNDPIYVKLEKLDIMIRLASEANIVQVLSELKEYATEVDVDFVRKAVRAIGRCAIKVETSAERCVSTLLDLIQTKVNYVVQEAIVVIKDIFRKYPNKYESIISTLCENLDTLDEPEARASMVWIIGEYAERIDNADELLESFLEGFHDENTQVQLQLLTAIVKLFLKRPTDTQELVQQVLSLATQDSDNPDLRDRGFIYWRLLSTDPAAAKEVRSCQENLFVLELHITELNLWDASISHIDKLSDFFHRYYENLEGRLLQVTQNTSGESESNAEGASQVPVATVIPSQDSLIPDLLNMDINTPAVAPQTAATGNGAFSGGTLDLLGGGLDSLLGGGTEAAAAAAPGAVPGAAPGASPATNNAGLLGDIFGIGAATSTAFAPPKQVFLPANRGKGLEVSGTFTRRNGQISMDLTLTNKAMQPLTGFAVQLNKNSFGVSPAGPLNVAAPLAPNQTIDVSLPLNINGPVQRMDPLNNLQVALKTSVDISYFACNMPMHVFFTEDGAMDKRIFLSTWKDIPSQNEVQYNIDNINMNADGITNKLQSSNIFTIAKRNVDGQDMLYQSIKLTNGIWVLTELKVQPGNTTVVLSLKSRATDVAAGIFESFDGILHS
ncbi:unnamed protein product, partial [Meganyctiphanes norvegica]